MTRVLRWPWPRREPQISREARLAKQRAAEAIEAARRRRPHSEAIARVVEIHRAENHLVEAFAAVFQLRGN